MSRRPKKEMTQARELVLQMIADAKKTHVLSFSANDVAKTVGISVSTACEILQSFGMTTDGWRWYFPVTIV